jgi:hypothetical protein
VNHWEVWNEPNLQYFLNPQKKPDGSWNSPTLYRGLLNAFAQSVRSVYASPVGNTAGRPVIVAGATAPFTHTRQPGPLRFMRRVLCLNDTNRPLAGCTQKASFDAWSTHPYTNGGPTHKAANAGDVSLGDLPKMRRVLNAGIRYNRIVHPSSVVGFWVGEFGWDSRAPDPKAVGMALHSRWVSEAVYRAWLAGANTFIWHQLSDRPLPAEPYQAGLFFCGQKSLTDDVNKQCESSVFNFNQNAQKRSFTAFQFVFVAFKANGRLKVWGRPPGAAPGQLVSIERKTSSGWARIKLLRTNSVGLINLSWRYSRTRGLIRAHIPGTTMASLGFSLVRPADRIVRPFGCGGGVPC